MADFKSSPLVRLFHLVGRNWRRLSRALALTSAGASPVSIVSSVLPAAGSSLTARMSTIAGLLRAGELAIGEQLFQPRQHRLRPQFPDEVGDRVVPLGEVRVEVREDRVSPFRVVAEGDVQGGEVEDVTIVEPSQRHRREG